MMLLVRPLGAIGRPDVDAVAGFQPSRDGAPREGIDAPRKLGIGPANILVQHNQRVLVGEARRGRIEQRADRLVD